MANLPLAFGEMIVGGVILMAGLSGKSIGQVINGGFALQGFGTGSSGGSSSTGTASSSVTGGTPAHGDVPANAQEIYSSLRAFGLSQNAAAGIVGNIAQESSGNPTAQEAGGSGYGLIQWTPGSASRYGTTVAQQIPEIISYIEANGSIADINSHANSPAEAALYFSQRYERPLASAANNPYRQASANAVAQAAQAGGW